MTIENMSEEEKLQGSQSGPEPQSRFRQRIVQLFHRSPELGERMVQTLNKIRERGSKFFSDTGNRVREKWTNLPFNKEREQIETGEDLRNFLSEIRGRVSIKLLPPKTPCLYHLESVLRVDCCVVKP